MNVQPYVFFDGKCEEALEFYKGAIGAKVDMMMRFSESPEKPQPGMVPPGSENKVMHAAFKVGDTQILASDGHCAGKPSLPRCTRWPECWCISHFASSGFMA